MRRAAVLPQGGELGGRQRGRRCTARAARCSRRGHGRDKPRAVPRGGRGRSASWLGEYREDVNDLPPGAGDGIGWVQGRHEGGHQRASAARSYLRSFALNRPNLQIETDALVEQGSCSMVSGQLASRNRARQAREARVNREVIVSCGSVQSPRMLEHSGVGDPEHLAATASGSNTSSGASARHPATTSGADDLAGQAPITLNQQSRGLGLVKEVLSAIGHRTRRPRFDVPASSTASCARGRASQRRTCSASSPMPATCGAVAATRDANPA